jgi:type IV pilus assembly protein PilB
MDMGIEPYLVSASLVGVVAQRLVRRICPNCKTTHMADTRECGILHLDEPKEISFGVGCSNCNNTGYKGRIAIHEILLLNKELREIIDAEGTTEQLRQASKKFGTRTLKESCTDLVLGGITTIDELIKVAYTSE